MAQVLVGMSIIQKLAPVIIALVVFIVLAGIIIGVGSKQSVPGWAIALLVLVAGGATIWGYRAATNRRQYDPGYSNYGQQYSMQSPPMGMPMSAPMGIPITPSYNQLPQGQYVSAPPALPTSLLAR